MKLLRRNIIKYGYPFGRMFWFFSRPNTVGVAVMLINSKNQILLVKHSYKKGYYFPGGGVSKGEHLEDAARREVREEVNLDVGELGILGVYRKFNDFKNDTTIIFFTKDIKDESKLKIDNIEIIEGRWCDIENLPKETRKSEQKRVKEYLSPGNKVYTEW